MKVPVGPYQRAGQRRRRGKVLVLAGLLAALALAGSWVQWDKPTPPERISRSEFVWMTNRAALSPGDARDFARQNPELSDVFLANQIEKERAAHGAGTP